MNTKIFGGIVLVVVAGGAFYAGSQYTQNPRNDSNRQSGATTGQFARGGGGRGGGFTGGEIISKDANSITIKMPDGSTKIVLVAASTEVMKSAKGALDDLKTGLNVSITGASNTDGSVTAQSIQIRPVGFSFGSSTRQIPKGN